MEPTPRIFRFEVLSIASIACIMIAFAFHLALFIKPLGAGGLLHLFHVVDQALFDVGDLLLLLGLPSVAFSLTIAGIVRGRSGRLPLILLGVLLGLYLALSVTGYTIIDSFYESRHLSLYD